MKIGIRNTKKSRVDARLLVLALLLFVGCAVSKQGPKANPISGATVVHIPGGMFIAGDTPGGQLDRINPLPRMEIFVDEFWIMETPVTNAQYAACFAAGACPDPLDPEDNPHYFDAAYADHPVVFISWFGAVDYCEWTGGRLPTEVEWEKAARGTDGRSYPWGEDNLVTAYAWVAQPKESTTVPVGSFAAGASPYGVLDLGGNVREWVADWYAEDTVPHPSNPTGPDDGELKVLRGAAWSDSKAHALTFARFAHDPASPGQNRGFRCVYSD